MYERLCGIRIVGDMLDNETDYNLFDLESNQKFPTRMSIVYGKNGSGKSTITKGFEKYSGITINSLRKSELYGFGGVTLAESEDMKKNIFVFNESFVEKNVKLKEDGLGTIVMFGEQADLEDEINTLETNLKIRQTETENQEKVCKEYRDSTKDKSPEYHWNRISELLKGDANWAGIEKRIKGNARNATVNDDIIGEVIKAATTKKENEVKKELDDKLNILIQISGEGTKIEAPILKINSEIDIDKINSLLSKKIENPTLSDRDKKIMEMVKEKQGYQQKLMEAKQTFSDKTVTECPYCLQSIEDSYKEDLVQSIEKIFSKEADKHMEELKAVKIALLCLDFSSFDDLDKEKLSEVRKHYNGLNIAISQYNEIIDNKLNNIYTPIENVNIDYHSAESKLIASLADLEELRIEYNKKFDEEAKTKNEAMLLNKQLAWYKIANSLEDYQKRLNEKTNEETQLSNYITEKCRVEEQLGLLKRKQKSTEIAVNFINDGLKYIFFSSDRLVIKPEEDRYVLFSNNKSVMPQDISCGERNILALCYFFTLMMADLNEKDVYTKESLLVIDDPVSSFDLDHKIGILSYLKSQLLKVMRGNLKSRVIVFSHDLPTIYDMIKQFEEIKEAIKDEHSEAKKECTTNFSKKELKSFTLQDFLYRKRNEYSLLLQTIYKYANSTDDDNDIAIGNIMRRALESFATFEYKKGIESISCDRQILDSMENDKYSQYFENLMYRLVLHGESHMEDHIKSLHDLNFYHTIETNEKRRTAKDVLCLINVLNKSHLEAHLDGIEGESNVIPTIQSWCDDILQQ